jgi:hypothetical protein
MRQEHGPTFQTDQTVHLVDMEDKLLLATLLAALQVMAVVD